MGIQTLYNWRQLLRHSIALSAPQTITFVEKYEGEKLERMFFCSLGFRMSVVHRLFILQQLQNMSIFDEPTKDMTVQNIGIKEVEKIVIKYHISIEILRYCWSADGTVPDPQLFYWVRMKSK